MSCTTQDVLVALNDLRTNPTSYIPELEEKLKYFKGNTCWIPGKIGLMTQEGPAAVQECIQALKNQKPVCKLRLDSDLSKAAQVHANDIGPKGICGHTGSDNSSMTDRINRYGTWGVTIGENINFSENDSARNIVIQLIIDDGVSSRGHRVNCFNDKFTVVGVGLAEHKTYKGCCVMDFAGSFQGNGSNNGYCQYVQPKPQQQQQQQQQQQLNNLNQNQGSSDMPPGCISKSTSVQTSISGNKKTVVTKTTYKFQDGSTKEETSTQITQN